MNSIVDRLKCSYPSSRGSWRLAQFVIATKAFVIGAVLTITGGFAGSSEANSNWTRDVTDGGRLADYPGVPFLVLITSSVNDHLSAECAYQLVDPKATVILHGTKDSRGSFHPSVSYQIATRGKTEWKTIGESVHTGKEIKIEINGVNPRLVLTVDMDVFRSAVGKFRWGRIVLENGDSAPFAIDDLLPTAPGLNRTGNFKKTVVSDSLGRFGNTLSLVTVKSFAKQLVGGFIFRFGSDDSFAELAGARGGDGDFWPTVTFQAGNSDSDWQTLQAAESQTAATTEKISYKSPQEQLWVNLDVFKGVKLSYGKIVLSDGQFAVFRIADLDSSPEKP